MEETYYPIAIKLKDRTAIVVGGGKVAERKVQTLLEFGACVRVISPELTARLQKLSRFRRITWTRRVVRSSDIKGADIVIAATSDVTVNKNVSRLAKRAGIQVNVVDNPALCSFISPAVFHASDAVVAVYTHGRDPVLSRDIKNFLKEQWDVFLSYRDRL
ncbi:bifunctional precorrin-2 dehydrogenase/sirohydrochlorin ferrochelatase [bacterium]|jgi:precorrin-2 dehydrogenase/sirohydrochlorin ferrochelatase|nr:bifunctional precorrin-2 dehydrogenase/sirohydrochlorin ferrochelatase [bacterium]